MLFDLRIEIDGTALGLLSFVVPVQTKACDPKKMTFLCRSIFGLPSIMVAGLMVSVILFLEGNALITSVIPSTRDLSISIMILWNGIVLRVDLNRSLIVHTALSIKPTCSSRP